MCYKGKSSQENKDKIKTNGLAYTVVNKLHSMSNYLKKGYYMFTDNFLTSLPCVEMLYRRYTFSTCTVKQNKKSLPNEIKGQIGGGIKSILQERQWCSLRI